jgi:hypothetical protein
VGGVGAVVDLGVCPWCIVAVSKHHDVNACRDAWIGTVRSLQRSRPGWLKKEE